MGSAHPPMEYLSASSNISLESFELSRLNTAANLRKEIRQIVDNLVQAEIEARVARWVLDCRCPRENDRRVGLEPLPDLAAETPKVTPADQEGLGIHSILRTPGELTPGEERLQSSFHIPPVMGQPDSSENLSPNASAQSSRQGALFEQLSCSPEVLCQAVASSNATQGGREGKSPGSAEEFERTASRVLTHDLCEQSARGLDHSAAYSDNSFEAVSGNLCSRGKFARESPVSSRNTQVPIARARSRRHLIATERNREEQTDARMNHRACRPTNLPSPLDLCHTFRPIQFHRVRLAAAS